MDWYTAAKVTATQGSKIVRVVSGEFIDAIRPHDGLQIGDFGSVDILKTYTETESPFNEIIELVEPWGVAPHVRPSQVEQPAVVVPNAAHFNDAATALSKARTDVFAQLGSFFAFGTQASGTVTFKGVSVNDPDVTVKSIPQYKTELDALAASAGSSVADLAAIDTAINGTGGLVDIAAQVETDLGAIDNTLSGYVTTAKSYRDTTLEYRNTAKTYQDNAKSYRDTTLGYKNQVGTWHGQVNTWQANALSYRNTAQQYRDEAEAFKNQAGAIVGGNYVDQATTVNGKPLSSSITLNVDDFGLTGTNRINQPLVHLFAPNVVVEKLRGALSVTRATTATYIDRYGVLQTAGIDELRVNDKGALIEGESTNLLLNSENLDGNTNNTRCTVLDTGNTFSGMKIFEVTATADNGYFNQTAGTTFLPDTEYTFSMFVKKVDARYARLVLHTDQFGLNCRVKLDLDTGIVTGENTNKFGVEKYIDGWFRLWVSAKTTSSFSSTRSPYFWPDPFIAGEKVLCTGWQLEALPFPSSYIPTLGIPVNRAADNVFTDLADNLPLNPNSDISVVAHVTLLHEPDELSPSSYVFGAYGSASSYIMSRFSQSNNYISLSISDGGVGSSVGVPSDNERNVGFKVASIFNGAADTLQSYVNSSTDSTVSNDGRWADVSMSIPLSIGGYGNNSVLKLFGYLKNFRIYDFALTEEEVKLL